MRLYKLSTMPDSAEPSPSNGEMQGVDQIFGDLWTIGPTDAQSYFLRSPEGGVLIDPPDDGGESAPHFEKNGGLRWIFLTHRDSVSGAAAYAERFGAEVLIHEDDRSAIDLPVRIFREDFDLADGLKVIWTPGRTAGSSCLLCDKHEGVLFTGEHILLPKAGARPVSDTRTWNWDQQLDSAVKLLGYEFAVLLPYRSPWRRGLAGVRAKLERALSEIEAEEV